MTIKTTVPVKLHKSAERHPFQSKTTSVELDKPEFFKYAVYVREVKSISRSLILTTFKVLFHLWKGFMMI